ncbi:hypothetical protein [Mariniblastus fucicola]|uniref:Uncharacterized protein n=1 Tax=Mariniblastus fucicola TaxID=980251 RepID=A0A5B9P5H8_9BACT|nr:hypothetical protein [Mariniblastus fucicola]QEG20425.1 hypothetical protein MFFC18_02730 [Mariniblastus fucicola]
MKFLIVTLAIISLAFVGCGETPNQTESTELSQMNTVAPAEQTTLGCCGKCAAETDASAKTGGNDCNACAEGGSNNCQCVSDAEDVTADEALNKPEANEKSSTADQSTTANDRVKPVQNDRDVFHYLLENHDQITRSVTNIENGVETLTESDDPAIAAKIQEHVAAMHHRIKDIRPLRRWDELFVKIFEHADEIKMKLENTEKGIKVIETSENEDVVSLIQQHAKVVSGFADHGFGEARKNHPVAK